MAAKTQQSRRIDRQLVHVAAHHIRVKALSILAERTASPNEIAKELGERVGTVSHHIKELEKAGLVELVGEKPRRGAVEHYYRAIIRPLMSSEEWDKLSLEERQQVSAWTTQLILSDAVKALTARTFDARSDRHLSRAPLVLDEEGWSELVQIQSEALKATLEVQATSAGRLAKSGGEGFHAVAAAMCFEMPGSKAKAP